MPSRYICSILDEMRKCHETRNFAYLPGLIEEAQMLANRMEAALWDQDRFRRAEKECRAWKNKKKELPDAD